MRETWGRVLDTLGIAP